MNKHYCRNRKLFEHSVWSKSWNQTDLWKAGLSRATYKTKKQKKREKRDFYHVVKDILLHPRSFLNSKLESGEFQVRFVMSSMTHVSHCSFFPGRNIIIFLQEVPQAAPEVLQWAGTAICCYYLPSSLTVTHYIAASVYIANIGPQSM